MGFESVLWAGISVKIPDEIMAIAAVKPTGVSQTNFIFAMIFVMYLIYITLNGDLAKWLGVFGLGSAASGTQAQVTGQGNLSSITQGVSSVGNLPALPALPTLGTISPVITP